MSKTNPTRSLALAVLDVVGHLDEVIDVLSQEVGSHKAATMVDCAQRYILNLEDICNQAVEASKTGGAA